MNQLVLDFLLGQGYYDVAVCFIKETGQQVEESALDDAKRRSAVRAGIESGNIEEALSHLKDLSPQVIEPRSRLLFRLQLQRLIEMVRAERIDKALMFAEETLAPLVLDNPIFAEEMEGAVAALALGFAQPSPFAHLGSKQRRQRLADEVNDAIRARANQNTDSSLTWALKLMQWEQHKLREVADFPSIINLSRPLDSLLPPPPAPPGQPSTTSSTPILGPSLGNTPLFGPLSATNTPLLLASSPAFGGMSGSVASFEL